MIGKTANLSAHSLCRWHSKKLLPQSVSVKISWEVKGCGFFINSVVVKKWTMG